VRLPALLLKVNGHAYFLSTPRLLRVCERRASRYKDHSFEQRAHHTVSPSFKRLKASNCK
jgi:hypothetical protein